jgi:PAS domain S-box-containing protein
MVDNTVDDLLKAVIDSMSGEACVIGSDGIVSYQNASLGDKCGEITGKVLEDLAAQAPYLQSCLLGYRSAMQGNTTAREIRIGGGKATRHLCFATPIYADGDIHAVICVHTDTTHVGKIEDRLKDAQWEATQLFDYAAPSILITREFGVKRVNKTFCQEFGVADSRIIGQKCFEVWPSPQCNTPHCPMHRLADGKESYEYEWKDEAGTGKWYAIHATPYRDRDGKVLGIVESYIDVTDSKTVQEQLTRARNNLEAAVQERTAELHRTNEKLKQEITERSLAQAHLTKTQADLRGLMNSTSETMALVSTDGRLIDINRNGAMRLGGTPEELRGRSVFEFFPEDIARDRSERFKEVLLSKKAVHFRDNRAGRVYDQNFYPVFDENNKIHSVAVFARDITDQVKSESALRDREAKIEAIINSIPESVFLVDRNLTAVAANEAAAKKLRMRRDEVVGLRISQLSEPLATSRKNMLQKVFDTKQPAQWQDSRDGIRFDTTVYPVFDDSGEVNQIVVFGRDITEIVKAQETLRESEERFRIIAEQSMLGLLIIQDGKVIYTNPALDRIIDYSAGDLSDSTVEDTIKVIHPEDRDYVQDQIQLKLEGSKRANPNYSFRIIRSTGEMRWIEVYSLTVTINAKPALLASLVDVTTRMQAEYDLRELNDKLIAERRSLEEANVLMDGIMKKLKSSEESIKSGIAERIQTLVMPNLQRLEHQVPPNRRLIVKSVADELRNIAEDIRPKYTLPPNLTRREREICHHIRNGYISKEIAEIIGISDATIFKHRQKIRDKLGLTGKNITLEAWLQQIKTNTD